MEICNFPGVICATDGSKGSTGMGASADTIPKEADAAGWGEVLEEARPVGPNLRQHAWPSKTLSSMTNLLQSLQTLQDSL